MIQAAIISSEPAMMRLGELSTVSGIVSSISFVITLLSSLFSLCDCKAKRLCPQSCCCSSAVAYECNLGREHYSARCNEKRLTECFATMAAMVFMITVRVSTTVSFTHSPKQTAHKLYRYRLIPLLRNESRPQVLAQVS